MNLGTVRLLVFVVIAVVLVAVAWHYPVIGDYSWSESTAIRKAVSNDPRTKGESILEISKGIDEVAEVDIESKTEGKSRTAFLQKRNGRWVIVTFSRRWNTADSSPD